MTGVDSAVVEAVLNDWKTADVSQRLHAALSLVETMTLRPSEMDSEWIQNLTAELTVAEIEEIAGVCFHFNFINRVSDAVDFELLDPKWQSRQTRILNRLARIVTGGNPPKPSSSIGNDGIRRPVELNITRDALLAYQGTIDTELRRNIEAYAASLWQAERPSTQIPSELEPFVKPLSLHAYRIYDELIPPLKKAGYTDQQLFEITLIGALGAAMPAQERLFKLLYD